MCGGKQHAVNHVTKEKGLFRLTVLADTNMRKHLLLQQVPRILQTLVLVHVWPRHTTLRNQVHRHLHQKSSTQDGRLNETKPLTNLLALNSQSLVDR
jgi:hypothetical protein